MNEDVQAMMGLSITGMLLVAFLDDDLSWDERQAIVPAVRVLGPHVTADQVLKLLDETAEKLAEVPLSNWPDLFVSGQSLSREFKVMILAMCTQVAFADGHLDPDEGRLIHHIAQWIDLDAVGRGIWKENVQQALGLAKDRGAGKFTGLENRKRLVNSLAARALSCQQGRDVSSYGEVARRGG